MTGHGGHGGGSMDGSEKRRHKRLPLKLDLSCHRVDCPSEVLHSGRTVNVSTSGIYFETPSKVFEAGHMLKVELSIPPTDGLLEFGGRISGFAKVLRTHSPPVPVADVTSSSAYHGVAVEFCQPPRLST